MLHENEIIWIKASAKKGIGFLHLTVSQIALNANRPFGPISEREILEQYIIQTTKAE